MESRVVAANLTVLSVEVRLYLLTHLSRLHLDELIGGKRMWRIQDAHRTWRYIRSGREQSLDRLAAKPIRQWSIGDLHEPLSSAPGMCTWPLPHRQKEEPPAVRAARLEH